MGKILHASKSGYFPGCITTIDSPPTTGPSSGSTFGIALEDAMAMFWRVREWSGRITGSFLDGNLNEIISFPDNDFVVMGITSKQINSEEDFICGYDGFAVFRDINSLLDGQPVSDQFLGFEYRIPKRKTKDELYFSDTFYLSATNTLAPGAVQTFTSKTGSFKIELCGREIVGDTFGPDNSSDGNVNIEIKATKYWSYGGTWDTETGNKLD